MRHSLRNTHNTVFIYIRQTWDIFTHILCYVACDVWHLYSGRLMCHNLRYLVTLITITVTINITITISLTLSAYLLGSLTDLQDPRFRGDEGELEVDGSICCSWFSQGKSLWLCLNVCVSVSLCLVCQSMCLITSSVECSLCECPAGTEECQDTPHCTTHAAIAINTTTTATINNNTTTTATINNNNTINTSISTITSTSDYYQLLLWYWYNKQLFLHQV